MDISYSELRQNLKSTIDKAVHTHEPFFITSHKTRKAYADTATYPSLQALKKQPGRLGIKDSLLDYPLAFAERRGIDTHSQNCNARRSDMPVPNE